MGILQSKCEFDGLIVKYRSVPKRTKTTLKTVTTLNCINIDK